MQGPWKSGDHAVNSCPRCRQLVRARMLYRSVQLAHSRLVVRDVLVNVCPNCDHMISFTPQAMEQLREAGCPK
jgi:hypothetical protein